MLIASWVALLALPTPACAQSADAANEIERLFGEQGVQFAMAAIFIIGLALNLTPCVYPMLAMTVGIFGAQTDTRLGPVFYKALPAAKAAQQPVVMDFYADWCIPCHELDRWTFSHPDVRSVFWLPPIFSSKPA
jgi:thiol:disulfide interchange protein